MQITQIDPFDDAAVDAWWDVYAAAERADRGPGAAVWTREESRKELQQESEAIERRAYVARRDGLLVGSASLALNQNDNTHIAAVAVNVLPAERGQGIGSEILSFLEEAASAADRTVVECFISWPHGRGTDGTGSPGREFARARGFELGLSDLQSTLKLPLDTTAAGALQAEADAASAGYTLHSWVGAVPEEFLSGWAELDAAVSTDAPTGTLDIEPATPNPAQIRESEQMLIAQNRTSYGSIAIGADGEAAAFSQLVVSGDDGNAYQWGTLVRRTARGHRLGLAVKLANLQLLQATTPEVTTVITFNAESNDHMLAINVALGFVPTERAGELQKRLG